jgi:hypothetical protein
MGLRPTVPPETVTGSMMSTTHVSPASTAMSSAVTLMVLLAARATFAEALLVTCGI